MDHARPSAAQEIQQLPTARHWRRYHGHRRGGSLGVRGTVPLLWWSLGGGCPTGTASQARGTWSWARAVLGGAGRPTELHAASGARGTAHRPPRLAGASQRAWTPLAVGLRPPPSCGSLPGASGPQTFPKPHRHPGTGSGKSGDKHPPGHSAPGPLSAGTAEETGPQETPRAAQVGAGTGHTMGPRTASPEPGKGAWAAPSSGALPGSPQPGGAPPAPQQDPRAAESGCDQPEPAQPLRWQHRSPRGQDVQPQRGPRRAAPRRYGTALGLPRPPASPGHSACLAVCHPPAAG